VRSILLVSPDIPNREALAIKLRKEIECMVVEADSAESALDAAEGLDISLLITDIFLPEKSGLKLMLDIRNHHPSATAIVSLPTDNRENILESLNSGALFYINSPFDLEEAVIVAARSLTHHDLKTHKETKGPKIRKTDGFHGIIGKSAKMQKLFTLVEKIADDGSSTVLIQGESGTGKELISKAIHALSPRGEKNFVPVNCAAIPDELLESELFGYEKGAFTGATQAKKGRVQYADGGTLFLDEIGDMKPNLQAKLLRVLQEKEFEPVGGIKPIKVDVRIVAATHRDLEKAVKDGTFREDLYYRLSVVPIGIPPLRDRKDDIPTLIKKFMQVYNRGKKHPLLGFSPEAMSALISYPWPGNVRELENLVQRLVILHGGETIEASNLPDKYIEYLPAAPAAEKIESPHQEAVFSADELDDGADFNTRVSEFEDRLILQALMKTGGNKKEAAQLLNLKRTTLLEKIKKKQLDKMFTDSTPTKN